MSFRKVVFSVKGAWYLLKSCPGVKSSISKKACREKGELKRVIQTNSIQITTQNEEDKLIFNEKLGFIYLQSKDHGQHFQDSLLQGSHILFFCLKSSPQNARLCPPLINSSAVRVRNCVLVREKPKTDTSST